MKKIVTQCQEEDQFVLEWRFNLPTDFQEGTQEAEQFIAECEAAAEEEILRLVEQNPELAQRKLTAKGKWILTEVGKLLIRVFIPFGIFIP